MHCEDPGCLKACPAPGAIVQYANGIVDFISENCIGCGYCVKGCPFNIPRISKVDHKSYKCTLVLRPRRVGLEPACVKACPTGAIMFGSKADMTRLGRRAHRGSQVARLRQCGAVRSAGRQRHARDVCSAPRRQAVDLCRVAGRPAYQRLRVELGRACSSRWLLRASLLPPLPGSCTGSSRGRTRCSRKMKWKRSDCSMPMRSKTRTTSSPNGRTGMTRPRGNAHSQQHRDPASTTGSPAACFVLLTLSGLGDVPPVAVLAVGLVRRRPMDASDPSVDRHRSADQLCRADRAVLARQSLEQGRSRMDAGHRPRPRQRRGRRPRVGRFNAGQKFVFWAMALLIPVLFLTGIAIWEVYFSTYTSIETQRVALLIHSLAAIAAIIVWIIHVYAAIWVRGSMRAMTQGWVTPGWAWRHHRKWLRRLAATGSTGPRPRTELAAAHSEEAREARWCAADGQVGRQSARRRQGAGSADPAGPHDAVRHHAPRGSRRCRKAIRWRSGCASWPTSHALSISRRRRYGRSPVHRASGD